MIFTKSQLTFGQITELQPTRSYKSTDKALAGSRRTEHRRHTRVPVGVSGRQRRGAVVRAGLVDVDPRRRDQQPHHAQVAEAQVEFESKV